VGAARILVDELENAFYQFELGTLDPRIRNGWLGGIGTSSIFQ